MDREIPKKTLQRERRKRWLGYGMAGLLLIGGIIWIPSLMQSRVNEKDLLFSVVDRGTLEVSVSASGKIVPAVEEIITSPVSARIVEVYRRSGDSVEAGTPLLKLDLQSTETEYHKQLDEERMKQLQLDQLRMNNETYLGDLAMKVKVQAMKVGRMEADLRNERYLDSLGSGTTDRVRQAELAYNTGCLELEQLRQQYANEQKVKEADLKVKQLELDIFRKSLSETRRTLEDAQLRSPRKAILTSINTQVGSQVAPGSQVAVVSDLSHFRVDGEAAESYSDRIAAGARAMVLVGHDRLEGMVSSVTPLSRDGIMSFTVQLDDSSNRRLRSGLKVDIYVINAVREEALRISNGSFYVGAGEYELFVKEGSGRLVKRKVRLGACSYDQVEVLDGLKEGDCVVVSDMSMYQSRTQIKLKEKE